MQHQDGQQSFAEVLPVPACSTSPPSGNQVDGLPLVAHNAPMGRTGALGTKTMYGNDGLQSRNYEDHAIHSMLEVRKSHRQVNKQL